MIPYVFRPDPEPLPSKRWLARRFPYRVELIADLRHRIHRAPAPITACPPNPRHFGRAIEKTFALDLCDTPPYPHLFASLPETGRRTLLATAGYSPHHPRADTAWSRASSMPGSRLLTVGSVLSILEQALRQLPITTPDEAHATLQSPLRRRRTIAVCATATRAARPAFADFWASYISGFRAVLRSYGPVSTGPALLDGLRVADILAGATIVELKTGHLTEAHQFQGLIDQVLTYTLLAAASGYQVSAVAVYLARYHVLARYPIDALTTELAGGPVDTTEAGNHLATLIRAEHHQPPQPDPTRQPDGFNRQ
ncbi:hypothetical protein OG400_29720 [Micromonospora ureilytica]|uniref:hypothetical protein n=1 Tax=Micromonospora ureilytica TaxID=709868 RepID=UPI002E13146A|nr:hypothetical protein OG400_29720 [Micromonospora ureilytica]